MLLPFLLANVADFGHDMRSQFMLADTLTTFNFGGYGSTPRPVSLPLESSTG